MNVRYVVELTIEEREELEQMLAGGELGARKLKRAQVLLGSDRGTATPPQLVVARSLPAPPGSRAMARSSRVPFTRTRTWATAGVP